MNTNVKWIFDYRYMILFFSWDSSFCVPFLNIILFRRSVCGSVNFTVTAECICLSATDILKFELNDNNTWNIEIHKINASFCRMNTDWVTLQLSTIFPTHKVSIMKVLVTFSKIFSNSSISIYHWFDIDNLKIYWDVMFQSDIHIKRFRHGTDTGIQSSSIWFWSLEKKKLEFKSPMRNRNTRYKIETPKDHLDDLIFYTSSEYMKENSRSSMCPHSIILNRAWSHVVT